MNAKFNKLNYVLDGLMRRYVERVPDVNKITKALIQKKIIEKQEDIENDHVAFRTLGVPNLGIESLKKIFLSLGYTQMDRFYFERKKLNANWFHPPAEVFPRVFISELIIEDLPEASQSIILKYTKNITSDPVDKIELNDEKAIDNFLHTSLWDTPSYAEYQTLLKDSEYASWVIFNRYYLNHYTISVQNLPKGFNTIQEFNSFLESIGIKLNDSGGKAKISADGLLLQSSTVAELVEAKFADNVRKMISGSYVEFAERKILPKYNNLPLAEIKRSHRRDGFEVASADKIFESTYSSQTAK